METKNKFSIPKDEVPSIIAAESSPLQESRSKAVGLAIERATRGYWEKEMYTTYQE